MAEDILGKKDLHSAELARLTRGEIVLTSMDDLDDAFGEWDENAPIAQIARGSQAHALPARARAVTVSDPVTTSILARISQRTTVPATLEEALLALADGIPELITSDR